jgi:Sulfatase
MCSLTERVVIVRPPSRSPCRTLGLALIATLVALIASCTRESTNGPRPHDVVLVLVDALRADGVSVLGGAEAHSPAIDAFASDGIVYSRATAPATWCVPGVASLLTGRWPSFHGAERLGDGDRTHVRALDGDATTLAELLTDAGFRAAAFVAGSGGFAPIHGLARGFESFTVVPDGGDGGGLAERVGDWLAAHPERSFLVIGIGGLDEIEVGGPVAPRLRAALGARYRSDVAAVDRTVGEVLAALRAAGRYDDALVAITADHGKLLGEHGLAGDSSPPFEPQVHVPLIVKHAGARRAGEWVERRVSTLGLFATILATTGVAAPPGVQARPLDDLHPVWVEELGTGGGRLRAGYDGPEVKLISFADRGETVACFFDLSRDPDEVRPRCDPDAAPVLRAALSSFGRRDRPARPPATLATAHDPAGGLGAERAAN